MSKQTFPTSVSFNKNICAELKGQYLILLKLNRGKDIMQIYVRGQPDLHRSALMVEYYLNIIRADENATNLARSRAPVQ